MMEKFWNYTRNGGFLVVGTALIGTVAIITEIIKVYL